jgi:protein disulfide-isomerase A6
MVRATTLLAATAAFALDVHAESMYTKKSGVLSLTGMDYDRLIAKSNYTSVSPAQPVPCAPANQSARL